jgi:hypothetical protein
VSRYSYLLCLGVGEYTYVQGGEHAGVPIAFIGPRLPGAEECLKLSLGITPRIMVRFPSFGATTGKACAAMTRAQEWMVNKLRVPFPFAKYYQLMATSTPPSPPLFLSLSLSFRYLCTADGCETSPARWRTSR